MRQRYRFFLVVEELGFVVFGFVVFELVVRDFVVVFFSVSADEEVSLIKLPVPFRLETVSIDFP